MQSVDSFDLEESVYENVELKEIDSLSGEGKHLPLGLEKANSFPEDVDGESLPTILENRSVVSAQDADALLERIHSFLGEESQVLPVSEKVNSFEVDEEGGSPPTLLQNVSTVSDQDADVLLEKINTYLGQGEDVQPSSEGDNSFQVHKEGESLPTTLQSESVHSDKDVVEAEEEASPSEDDGPPSANCNLHPADLKFLETATHLTTDEILKAFQNFCTRFPSGKITRKDFLRAIDANTSDTKVHKIEKNIFHMYDTNEDNSIDFRESFVAYYILGHGTPRGYLKQIWRILDVDSCGYIRMSDLRNVVQALESYFTMDVTADQGGKTFDGKEFAKTAFKEMDKNQDGKVTQEEFVRACASWEQNSALLSMALIDIFTNLSNYQVRLDT